MIAAAAADAQTQRSDFRRTHIDARCIGAIYRSDVVCRQQIDHRLLHQTHQRAHREAAPLHVEQQINHDLAGTVVGDLPAAVDAYHRDAVVDARQMFVLAGEPQRVDRRMFEQPDFVRGVVVALGGELLHRLQRRCVVRAPKLAHGEM